MRFVAFVLLPLLLQAGLTALIIVSNTGGGSFVGLGAMVLSLIALPMTAIVNWLGIRAQPPRPTLALVLRTVILTAIWPVLVGLAHLL